MRFLIFNNLIYNKGRVGPMRKTKYSVVMLIVFDLLFFLNCNKQVNAPDDEATVNLDALVIAFDSERTGNGDI